MLLGGRDSLIPAPRRPAIRPAARLVCVGVGLVPHLAAVIRSTSLHFLYVFSRFTFSVLAFSIRARSSFALLFPLIPGRFFSQRVRSPKKPG